MLVKAAAPSSVRGLAAFFLRDGHFFVLFRVLGPQSRAMTTRNNSSTRTLWLSSTIYHLTQPPQRLPVIEFGTRTLADHLGAFVDELVAKLNILF